MQKINNFYMSFSFTSLLGLLFIGLKLGGIINWHWIWVLSPFWIGIAASFLLAAIFIIGGLIFLKIESKQIDVALKKIQEDADADEPKPSRFNLN